MQYKREIQQVKNNVAEELWDLLAEHNCIVAGGAFTSVFSNKPINDVDVYFRDKQSLAAVIEAIYNHEIDYSAGRIISFTDKSILLTSEGNSVQFIGFDYFQTIEELFQSYDYTINMIGLNTVDDSLEMHPDAIKHIGQRYLQFNPATAYPLISLLRVAKYKERGYNISKAQMLRLMLAINKLSLNSWDDVINHIGGMYGTAPKDIFNTEEPFSLDLAMDMLEEKSYKIDKSVMPKNVTHNELIFQFSL